MSGLFSNANYFGIWLSTLTPFSLTYLFEKNKSFINKILSFFINFFIVICTFYTYSRAAWLGIILSFFLLIKKRNYKWVILIFFFFGVLILLSTGIFPNEKTTDLSRVIVPEALWNYKFKNIHLLNLDSFIRTKIWFITLQGIIAKPLWGWGAGSFPISFIRTGTDPFFPTTTFSISFIPVN